MFEFSFSQASRLNSFFRLVSALLRGFPCSSVGKESPCSAGDPGLIPGLGRSPGEGNDNPLQYPCLENLRSLVGCSPWGHKELDMTEQLYFQGWSSGLFKLRIGWDLCWVFVVVCLFVFPLMGKDEWGGNPVCWWLGLHFCFVCCLHEVSCTGCYWWSWCWVLYSSGFLCVSSHYLIPPSRVSSLVV